MSTIDLVILGFAKKSPVNAYDMAKIIERTEMAKWLKIGVPTIFQNLRKLAKNGYLSAATLQNGNLPDKVVYTITALGEGRWLELMEKYSSDPGPIYFNFNAFIVNLSMLAPPAREKMLMNLREQFRMSNDGVREAIAAVPAPSREEQLIIMTQYSGIYASLLQWIDNLILQQGVQ